MKLIHFTFNNFFDYSIIIKQLNSKRWKFHQNNLTATFKYQYTSEHVIKHIEQLCKPLNIQFTTTLGISEDTE